MPAGFTPIYKITKDGEDITGNFNSRTLSIKVKLTAGGGNSDICEITIDDRDWKVAAVEPGVKIEVFLGYKEVGYAQMGVFEVTTVDYEISPAQIRIVGTGTSFTGKLKEAKNQSFQNKTLGEIVQELARQGGIEAFISPEIAQHRIPFVNQITSPMHLIHEIERRYGALAKVEGNRLSIVPRDAGQTVTGLGTMVLVLTPPNVTRGFVRHTTRGDYGSAKVAWYDADHRKHYVEEVDPAAPRDEDGELEDPVFLSGKLARSENEARAMAKAHLAAVRRTTGELHVTLSKGDPWVRDQMRTLMKGFRDKINGSYVNDTVTHTYVKDGGIQTEIFGKPPGDGADYSSLDEGKFYALGSGGVVGPAGPQLPDGSKVGVAPDQPDPPKDPDTLPPPPPPEPPVNT